ncbi:MAG: helix-turn-helix domain-containing protein [Actinobacteria bacterium]|nr:helix-turn-helix domain-containing protein [Actinomycetota bacterium]
MSDRPQEAPRFLTVAEVADVMRVSRMTVYRMVHSGQMPAVRMGRSFRVPAKAVEDLIAEGLADWEQSRAIGEDG